MGWRAPIFLFMPKIEHVLTPGETKQFVQADVTGRLMGERTLTYAEIGGHMCDWDGIAAFGEFELPRMKRTLSARDEPAQKRAFFEVCRLVDNRVRNSSNTWLEFLAELERDRFEPNAWFERDRRSLTLTDNVTGDTLVELWDEDVDDAIADGFLTWPKCPRPTDSDWLAPLVAYAKHQDLIPSLRADVSAPGTDRPRSRA